MFDVTAGIVWTLWSDSCFEYPQPSRHTSWAILCLLRVNLSSSWQLWCSYYVPDTVLRTLSALSHSVPVFISQMGTAYYPHPVEDSPEVEVKWIGMLVLGFQSRSTYSKNWTPKPSHSSQMMNEFNDRSWPMVETGWGWGWKEWTGPAWQWLCYTRQIIWILSWKGWEPTESSWAGELHDELYALGRNLK